MAQEVRQSRDDRSLGDLFATLSRETATLVRQEVTLARIEMTAKATRVGKDVGFLAAGGAVAYAGFLCILAAISLLVGAVIPLWLATLLVGLVVAGTGYALVRRGLAALKTEDVAPRQMLETLKEDTQWVKDQTR